MLIIARCFLCIVRCCWLLRVGRCVLLFVVLVYVARYLLFVACCLSFVVRALLFVVCYSLFVIRCLLSVVCCLLFVVGCLFVL